MLNILLLLSCVFSDGCMPISYQGADHQTTSKEICHAVLKPEELHSWAASHSIPLQNRRMFFTSVVLVSNTLHGPVYVYFAVQFCHNLMHIFQFYV